MIQRMNKPMIERVKSISEFQTFKFSFFLQNVLVPVDELFWSPSSADEIGDDTIDEYLKTIHQECNA